MIRSKINLFRLFTVFILVLLFFFITNLLFVKAKGFKDWIGVLFTFFSAIYTLYYYFKIAPIIFVGDKEIIIVHFLKKKKYLKSEILKINLRQVKGYEGMVIYFRDKKKVEFIDDVYANLAEIKKVLEYKIDSKDKKSGLVKFPKNKTVRGTYINFGMFCFFIFFGVSLMAFRSENWLTGIIILVISYFITKLLNYFSIEDDKFVVKNYILFWYTKEFFIKDILSIKKETVNARVYVEGIRVVTKEYKSYRFWSSPMRDKDWDKLFKDLIK
ncbi:hypothetical protein [uncultured Tenacibaculum sp.]|uniref:hypothetical protein n=1 Tax=uncultured Tenacibaculum sp. TaxID=174713 RepID=UPI002632D8F8|nr:hypothetical protein [uncultured Tenacibaculum sp.]